jgi:iron complex outermembrane recepter protein
VGEFTRINIDRSYRLGLELNGALQLLPALQWTGSLTLSRNQIIAFEENVDQYDADFNKVGTRTVLHQNTDLAFAPPVIAAMALEYQITPATVQKHDLRMGLQGKYIGRQFIDNSSDPNNALDPYAFLDFRLDYTSQAIFGKTIRWNLLVNNVLNARYATNAWSYRYDFEGTPYTDQGFFPQAGVNFLLGMEVDF